jgi:hypothetical protein
VKIDRLINDQFNNWNNRQSEMAKIRTWQPLFKAMATKPCGSPSPGIDLPIRKAFAAWS